MVVLLQLPPKNEALYVMQLTFEQQEVDLKFKKKKSFSLWQCLNIRRHNLIKFYGENILIAIKSIIISRIKDIGILFFLF